MSYAILYNWQFIRSQEGLTPVILMGDNNLVENVWMGNHWGERCVRDWSCLFNLIGVSDEEFMSAIQSMTGKTYHEHWKRSGKWVDDKALINWAKNACKNATSIEEIKDENWNVSIDALLSVWKENENSKMLEKSIDSTAALDEWIHEAKKVCAELRNTGHSVYPIIKYGREDITRHRACPKHIPKTVVIKGEYGYLTEYEESGYHDSIDSSSWRPFIKDALVFEYNEAVELQKKFMHNRTKVRLIAATAKDAPYDAVIRAVRRSDKDGLAAHFYYVSKVTGSATRFVSSISSAKRYSNMSAATASAARLNARSQKYNYYAIQVFSLKGEEEA